MNFVKGLLGLGGGGTADVAQQAQTVKNGDIVIQLSPESKQIIFAIDGQTHKYPPIAFDLKTGMIVNASFPAAAEQDPVPL
jgi:hypothetical protein